MDLVVGIYLYNINESTNGKKTQRTQPRSLINTLSVRGSEGGGYLSTVRGTGTCHFLGVLFSNHYGILGIIFTIF